MAAMKPNSELTLSDVNGSGSESSQLKLHCPPVQSLGIVPCIIYKVR